MMWALGSGGSSLSSSSNLSPLAQPFTVDRFNNSKPTLNPHLNESPYSLPSSQSWQYTPHISASRSGFLSENSMETTSVPLADEKSVSQSADPSSSYWSTQTFGANSLMDEFSYISEGRPYYLPYASPVVSNNTPFLPINEATPDVGPTSGVQPGSVSSQVDYTQSLAGLHYSHSSSGVWNGLAHKKMGKKMQGNANLSFDNAIAGGSKHFKSPINQGAHALECRAETQDDSGTFFGNFTERETHEGFLKMGQMKEKCQKTYNAYEKCIQPLASHTCNDIPTPKSSTTVVIRPPEPAAVQISSTKRSPSFQTGQGGKFAAVQIDGLCSPPYSFKGEEHHQPLSSIGKGMYLSSKQLNVHPDDDDHKICNASLWSTKEGMAVQSHVDDTLKLTFESSSQSNATFTKVLDDMYLPSDDIQVVRYNESYQDGLDQHNPNVDSPCWKGTLASRTSPFDVEHMHPPQENHRFPSEVFSGATSSMLSNSNVVHNENGSALDGKTNLKGLLIENCPAKDHLSTDAGKVDPESQTHDSCDPSNCRTSNFCDSVDSVLNMNEVSQGCNVALDAAEKVLHSPSSQEDSELAHRHGRLSYPKLDVQTLVMAIHNLSELLRFQCSNDEPLFREAHHQALNHTINNLNACIPKKIGTMNTTQDKIVAVQNTVDGTKEGFHTDTGLTLPQIKIRSASCLHVQPTIQNMHGCDVTNEDLKPFLSISNPIIPKEDIMSQAIGKVLQENFEFDGEMESQALLFKNLWLEAEAKLCSLSYKARFDHMKIAMHMQKPSRAVDENVASAEKNSGFIGVSSIDADECSLHKPCIQSQSISHSANDILGRKGSVTSRYNILKYREENSSPMYVDKERGSDVIRTGFAGERSNRRPHIEHAATVENIPSLQASTSNCDADSSVMARLNILRGRDSYLGEEQFEPMHLNMSEEKIGNAAGGMVPPFLHHPTGMAHEIGSIAAAGKESTKAFHFSAPIDAAQQTNMHNRAASALHNTSSSDWEHIVKDDFVAWHG